MKIAKTGPTVPINCQPIRNDNGIPPFRKALFKGEACQPIRDENKLSVWDRHKDETNEAIDAMNKEIFERRTEALTHILYGMGIGAFITLIWKMGK